MTELEIPKFFEREIIHYQQLYNWDCGLSCIIMCLPRTQRNAFTNNFNEICKQENFGKNTWTIDLCYVLKRFSIPHKYFTATLGVNPEYRSHSYYDKIIETDALRVYWKFQTAKRDGMFVEQKTGITNDYLMQHLARHGPIILLTNSALLTCSTCKENKLSTEISPWAVTYSGHYILLVGYNRQSSHFLYHNPAKKNHVCVMPINCMTQARLADGTDEDMILIYSQR